MERALPIAVKFLQKGNKELSKNLSSYLSLAAIEYAYLLGPHISQILDSIAIGNYGLCQILPQIYEVSTAVLDKKVVMLVPLLRTCDVHEKLALLQLFTSIVKRNPAVINPVNSFNQYGLRIEFVFRPWRVASPKYVIRCPRRRRRTQDPAS